MAKLAMRVQQNKNLEASGFQFCLILVNWLLSLMLCCFYSIELSWFDFAAQISKFKYA